MQHHGVQLIRSVRFDLRPDFDSKPEFRCADQAVEVPAPNLIEKKTRTLQSGLKKLSACAP